MKWVNWRALLGLPGGIELKARAKSVFGQAVMVQSDIPLPKGAICDLVLSVERDVAVRAVCRVGDSVFSAASYLVWLDVLVCHEGEQWLQA